MEGGRHSDAHRLQPGAYIEFNAYLASTAHGQRAVKRLIGTVDDILGAPGTDAHGARVVPVRIRDVEYPAAVQAGYHPLPSPVLQLRLDAQGHHLKTGNPGCWFLLRQAPAAAGGGRGAARGGATAVGGASAQAAAMKGGDSNGVAQADAAAHSPADAARSRDAHKAPATGAAAPLPSAAQVAAALTAAAAAGSSDTAAAVGQGVKRPAPGDAGAAAGVANAGAPPAKRPAVGALPVAYVLPTMAQKQAALKQQLQQQQAAMAAQQQLAKQRAAAAAQQQQQQQEDAANGASQQAQPSEQQKAAPGDSQPPRAGPQQLLPGSMVLQSQAAAPGGPVAVMFMPNGQQAKLAPQQVQQLRQHQLLLQVQQRQLLQHVAAQQRLQQQQRQQQQQQQQQQQAQAQQQKPQPAAAQQPGQQKSQASRQPAAVIAKPVQQAQPTQHSQQQRQLALQQQLQQHLARQHQQQQQQLRQQAARDPVELGGSDASHALQLYHALKMPNKAGLWMVSKKRAEDAVEMSSEDLEMLSRWGTKRGVSRRGGRSTTSAFRGVTQHRRSRRWEAHIWMGGKQVYLGSFDTDREAAMAHDLTSVRFFGGRMAVTNFCLSNYAPELAALEAMAPPPKHGPSEQDVPPVSAQIQGWREILHGGQGRTQNRDNSGAPRKPVAGPSSSAGPSGGDAPANKRQRTASAKVQQNAELDGEDEYVPPRRLQAGTGGQQQQQRQPAARRGPHQRARRSADMSEDEEEEEEEPYASEGGESEDERQLQRQQQRQQQQHRQQQQQRQQEQERQHRQQHLQRHHHQQQQQQQQQQRQAPQQPRRSPAASRPRSRAPRAQSPPPPVPAWGAREPRSSRDVWVGCSRHLISSLAGQSGQAALRAAGLTEGYRTRVEELVAAGVYGDGGFDGDEEQQALAEAMAPVQQAAAAAAALARVRQQHLLDAHGVIAWKAGLKWLQQQRRELHQGRPGPRVRVPRAQRAVLRRAREEAQRLQALREQQQLQQHINGGGADAAARDGAAAARDRRRSSVDGGRASSREASAAAVAEEEEEEELSEGAVFQAMHAVLLQLESHSFGLATCLTELMMDWSVAARSVAAAPPAAPCGGGGDDDAQAAAAAADAAQQRQRAAAEVQRLVDDCMQQQDATQQHLQRMRAVVTPHLKVGLDHGSAAAETQAASTEDVGAAVLELQQLHEQHGAMLRRLAQGLQQLQAALAHTVGDGDSDGDGDAADAAPGAAASSSGVDSETAQQLKQSVASALDHVVSSLRLVGVGAPVDDA